MTKKEDKKLKHAAIGGGAVLGGLAGYEGLKHYLADKYEKESVKASPKWADFLGQLEPGDIIFHRTPSEYSGNIDINKREIPIKENDLMKMLKGDSFYHSSVYKGNGVVTESSGMREGVKNSRARGPIPQELMAYRPKDKRQIPGALKHLKESVGREYADHDELYKHVLQHLSGIEPSSKEARKICGNTVCTELTAEAYPKIFPKTTMSPADMRHSEDLKLIARYGKTLPISTRERLLTRVAYPLLKNAKYGLAAGAGIYGLKSLADYFRGDDNAVSA